MKLKSGIYKITSPIGEIYIGQARNLDRRKSEYKYMKCSRQPLLEQSLLKYGFANHLFEVLENCSIEALFDRESFYVESLKTNKNRFKDGNGLNLTDGGKGSWGYKHTKESKAKMSAIQCQLIRSPESNLKRSNTLKGRPCPENCIKAHKGKSKTQAHIDKIVAKNVKKVIDTSSNRIYESAKIAAKACGYNYGTLTGWLRGSYTNKSALRYL